MNAGVDNQNTSSNQTIIEEDARLRFRPCIIGLISPTLALFGHVAGEAEKERGNETNERQMRQRES